MTKEVEELQITLVNAGYTLDVDGEFGPKTQEALNDYNSKLVNQPAPTEFALKNPAFIGAIATVISGICALFLNVNLPTEQLTNVIGGIVVVSTSLGTLYGVFKHKAPITVKRSNVGSVLNQPLQTNNRTEPVQIISGPFGINS